MVYKTVGRYGKARPHFFQDLNLAGLLEPPRPQDQSFLGCKVVGTIGPACNDVETLADMISAGMAVGRVDLTWGGLDYHKRSLDNLNQVVMIIMLRMPRPCLCTHSEAHGSQSLPTSPRQ